VAELERMNKGCGKYNWDGFPVWVGENAGINKHIIFRNADPAMFFISIGNSKSHP
jgi:hypothetical protein